MLRALRELLDALDPAAGAPREQAVSVELATAVLLVEAMRADQAMQPEERAALLRILQAHFGLGEPDVRELLAAAEERSRRANDFFTFTSVLNDRLDQAQKIEVVEQMWRVAYIDGSADAGETHIISKVADLLHVTHGEYIAAKMRAKEAAGSGP